jgi:glutamate formiminotransferase / 5-formyltetrahydrofolate cyclo-ligase
LTLIAIPNLSEGRDTDKVGRLSDTVESAGAHVLDIHSDAVHNRSVVTVAGTSATLPDAMAALAEATTEIDLTRHRGVHPRLGALDVCPIVPHNGDIDEAIRTARATGLRIVERANVPVYFYGAAATRPETRALPSLRRGGLSALAKRALSDLPPDLGSPEIDLSRGVVCVGARDVLIAFNVWLHSEKVVATAIAHRIRSSGGGPPGIRALAFQIDDSPTSQVSMNLVRPSVTGIDDAFEAVAAAATEVGATLVATEIVGLVPRRFLPNPDAQAARLLIKPGRSLESALIERLP